MKILWIKTGGLVPTDTGGKIRSFNIAKQLAYRHPLTLFTFYPQTENDEHRQLGAPFARLECFQLPMRAVRSVQDYGGYLRGLFSLYPYSLAKYRRADIAQRMRQLLQQETYDVVVCDFLFAAPSTPWHLPCPKVLFTHNVETQIWKRHLEVSQNPLWKLVSWREYQAMKRVERRYIQLANRVIAVSAADRDAFTAWVPAGKISVIPTGVDVDFFQPSGQEEAANHMAFTGSMDWLPNEDGVGWFVREVMPRIAARSRGATFSVIGRKPSSAVQSLASDSVRVTGTVDDIRPHVQEAAVYVVPLRIGGGTRLKIFEAMAMGKAVVSTRLGAEGLPVTDGENILLADEPQAFAAAVTRLFSDADLRRRLGRSARKLVEEKYGWASVARHFEEILEHSREGKSAMPAPAGV